jgi:hypothetical protein
MPVTDNFDHLKTIVYKALADKELSRAEQEEIVNAILDDNQVSPEEQELLSWIAEHLQRGEIKVVD